MDLSRLTYVMNEIRHDMDKLIFLCSLRGTEYEKYIWDLIPSDLKVRYSYYNELDCVNDILVMRFQKYNHIDDAWPHYIDYESEFTFREHLELGDILDTVNMDTLRYFMEAEELNISCRCILSAIEKKRLDIIRFLRQSRYSTGIILYFAEYLLHAIKYGTFEILDEIVKMIPEDIRDLYEERIYEVFGRYKASRDYPKYPEHSITNNMKEAIRHKNLESVKWLHKRGLKIDLLDICMAIRLGVYDIAEWLKDNISEEYIEMSIEECMKGSITYGHDEVFNYLALIVLGK